MQKTQIVYKGKKPDITELQELMPHLDITLTHFLPEDIQTVIDPIYKIKTIDWTWFRKQFTKGNDVNAFVFEKTDLKGVGINDHWGFYSLDEDTDHQFYMTDLGPKLIDKAIKNGFRTNFARMFCHEYLHGAVWGETRNRQLAAQLVHEWEAQGILKQKIKEDLDRYNTRLNTKNVLESIVARLKGVFKTYPVPQWNKPSQSYGVANSEWYPLTGHHIGTDFATPIGTPIKAHKNCVITSSGHLPKSLGYWCEVQYEPNYFLVFCHLEKQPAKKILLAGDIIGYTGDTGFIKGAHLHVEGWHKPMNRKALNKTSWKDLTFDVTKTI